VVWVALGAGALLFGLWLLRVIASAPVSALRQGMLWFAGLDAWGRHRACVYVLLINTFALWDGAAFVFRRPR